VSRSTIFGNDGGWYGLGSSAGAAASTFDPPGAGAISSVPGVRTVSPAGGTGGLTGCALPSDAAKQKALVRSVANIGARLGCSGLNARQSANFVPGSTVACVHVSDPELRQLGDARRSEVRANLDRVIESLTVAVETFDPFLNNLGDVQKVFGNDLTPQGQLLVSNTAVAQGANEKGARVAQSIDVALAALSNMAGQMSSKSMK
jgi:hypothetical protein